MANNFKAPIHHVPEYPIGSARQHIQTVCAVKYSQKLQVNDVFFNNFLFKNNQTYQFVLFFITTVIIFFKLISIIKPIDATYVIVLYVF